MEEGRDAGRGCGDGWVEIKEKKENRTVHGGKCKTKREGREQRRSGGKFCSLNIN